MNPNGFQKGHIVTRETREKISKANRGKKKPWVAERNRSLKQRMACSKANKIKMKRLWKDPEYRKHMSEIHMGRHEKMENELHPQWKGKDVSYGGLHAWVARKLGKPDTCEFCGRSGLVGKQIDWANKSREYKRDLDDWLRLCKSCHGKYDGKYEGSIFL